MRRREFLASVAACAATKALAGEGPAFDVVVAGSGIAGLSAAVSAREAGAQRVLLIEKGPVLGGHSAFSSGSFAVFSPKRQAAQGIEDSVEEWIADAARVGGEIDREVLRRVITESESALEWLESFGVEFSRFLFQPIGGLRPRCLAPRSGFGGRSYVGALVKRARLLGVEVRLSAPLVSARRTGGLWRVGVGQGSFVSGRTLVIACGGFTGNTAMRIRNDPRFEGVMHSSANPDGLFWDGATGDGIQVAASAGAALKGMGNILYLPYWGGRVLDYAGAEIFVNAEGARFVSETGSTRSVAEAMSRQTDMSMWVITDAKSMKGVNLGAKISTGKVHVSDTIEEMARGMKIPADILRETLSTYNSHVDKGVDTEFGNTRMLQRIDTPPFYWGREELYVHSTLGGIAADIDARVLDTQGEPIAGLYAAGETVGGIFGKDRLAGMSVTNACVMGRVAGREAARFAHRRD